MRPEVKDLKVVLEHQLLSDSWIFLGLDTALHTAHMCPQQPRPW